MKLPLSKAAFNSFIRFNILLASLKLIKDKTLRKVCFQSRTPEQIALRHIEKSKFIHF